MGQYSRDNSGSGVWSGQNNSDQGLTVVDNVTGLQVNGTVTITATYTGSVTQVNINGYTITSGILTPDANTITAPVGLGGEVGQTVYVSIVDDNGTSTAFETTFEPETGFAAVKTTVGSGEFPENSIMVDEPGVVAGDIFYHEIVADSTESVVLNSELVPTVQLSEGTHTFDSSWRDSQTAGYDATATQPFTITVTDATPDAFSFNGYDRCGPSLEYTEVVPLAGMNDGESLYVTNGRVSNDGGISFTKSVIPYVTGKTLVQAQVTSDATPGNTVSTPITVNGVTANYDLTTSIPDVNPFSFATQTDLPILTPIDSEQITLAGTAGAYDIEVRGFRAKFSVNGGPYQSGFVSGGISVGDNLVVRMDSSGDNLETNFITVIIDGQVATFTTTTQAESVNNIDMELPPFFDQPLNTLVDLTSLNGLTIPTGDAGIYNLSVEGGEYNIGSTTWETAPTTYDMSSGLSINLRHTTSANNSEDTVTILTLGDYKTGFTTTTVSQAADVDPFSFNSQNNVPLNDLRVSNTITPTGNAGSYPISISAGGEYSIDGAGFTSTPGTFTIGSTVAVRQTSSGSNSTTTVVNLTIDTTIGSFSVTTEAAAAGPIPIKLNNLRIQGIL